MPLMEPFAAWSVAVLELWSATCIALALVKGVKYSGFDVDPRLGLEDYSLLLLVALVGALAARIGSFALAFAWVVLLSVAFFVLWLDAVLFRVFTIELGTGGLGTVVLTWLYRELAELSLAKRFFASHRLFAVLPLFVVMTTSHSLLVEPRLVHRFVLGGLLVLYFVLARATTRTTNPSRSEHLLARRGVVRHLLRHARLTRSQAFVPRAEHEHLLHLTPRIPAKSRLFGRAQGADVVFITFESMGRDHLSMYSAVGAHTPFLARMFEGSVRSAFHFCISPNTNNAHVALYASDYSALSPFTSLLTLKAAGYQTVYMSATKTENYGLEPLLRKAGFDRVIDHDRLSVGWKGQEQLSDYAILDQGLAELAALRDRRPIFLHLHTTNTHVPYRVIDVTRFDRWKSEDDRGRFFNGLEETDWIVETFLEQLNARGLINAPLLAISGDHGQAFGQFGYQSHGSAVIKEQVNVPLLIHHPAITPGEIEFSSHLDVLPTILDLVGVESVHPGFGESIFGEQRSACFLLWAGHPSRARSSNFGLVLGDRKFMVDLIVDRCYEMDWNDNVSRVMAGEERDYFSMLIHRALSSRGLS
jgi:glucan phosphoethanolaminetransferase (alkaline phosphatase superfamily)